MTQDVAPELFDKIKKDFEERIKKSTTISGVQKKIAEGIATYVEANEYAIEVGECLAEAFKRNLSSSVLPNGKMYYNIAQRIIDPMMRQDYDLVTTVTNQVQLALNKESNIGIKPIKPALNEDRIKGIVNRVSEEESFDDIAWILDEPIKNYSQSIVDDSIKANADFQFQAGMTPKIVRKLQGGCCEWCREVAGTYKYPNVPPDVYRRHQRCRCTVTYNVGKYRTDVHTKRSYDDQGNAVNRKNYSKGILSIKTREEAEFVERELKKEKLRSEEARINKMIEDYQKSENVSHRRAANRIGRKLKEEGVTDALIEYRKTIDLSSSLSSEKKEYRKLLSDYGLSSSESRALVNYVSSDSYKVNDLLRRKVNLSESDKVFIDNLNSALDKMPKYEGHVTRDLIFMFNEDYVSFLETHTIGNQIDYSQFISSTKDKSYADNPQVRMDILSHSGRDISLVNEKENEVLFKYGTNFKVLSYKTSGDTIILELEEVENE